MKQSLNRTFSIPVTGSDGGDSPVVGTVSEYLQRKSEERERQAQQGQPPGEARSDEKLSAKDRRRREAELRQERSKRLKPIKDRIGRLEKTIAELEERKKDLEHLMADPEFFSQGEDAKRAPAEYKQIEADLAYAYREWEELAEQLAGEE